MALAPPNAPDLSRQLRSWRRARKLRQVDLSLRSGVAQQTISCIEGGRDTSVTTAVALANAMEITVDELLHAEAPAS
jgi:transcriptional regulator with XRE-family HTH domain